MADNESEAARLLAEYSSRPPKLSLTTEDQEYLRDFVIRDGTFRKLKDCVRVTAWQGLVQTCNKDAGEDSFPTDFAYEQGKRDGMLQALNLLEYFVEEQ